MQQKTFSNNTSRKKYYFINKTNIVKLSPKTQLQFVANKQRKKRKSLIAFRVWVANKCIVVVSLLDEPWHLWNVVLVFFFCSNKGYKNIKINFNVTAKIFSTIEKKMATEIVYDVLISVGMEHLAWTCP